MSLYGKTVYKLTDDERVFLHQAIIEAMKGNDEKLQMFNLMVRQIIENVILRPMTHRLAAALDGSEECAEKLIEIKDEFKHKTTLFISLITY